ncbi:MULTISPECIES: hypothetical protein [Arthrobacter]|uniref:Uncharacterized protein n=1 Tax=Arthrobacter terricola TaxID=2547396 RepID=A0A4R5KQ96_9MICC|nr:MULTISPECIES: hypothetical protein [Arthrobacter]MBT8161006.1 hypothetical protein [Arthrobacter sp. GN70]TDF96870.1 hypothetical protein E1809_09100 [Arthrobacter terricola]
MSDDQCPDCGKPWHRCFCPVRRVSDGLIPPVYDNAPSWHYVHRDIRFTDAELAAEVHRASAEVYRAKVHGLNPDGLIDRFMVLSRFASLPHFDEVQE